jgi:NADPH:quinone reductase-like Zn-dependent oxidoreductase
MRAIVKFDKNGNVGFSKELPVPVLVMPELVLVKVHSAPINPSDCYNMAGSYGPQPEGIHAAGFEGSGVVCKVHEDAPENVKALLGKSVAICGHGTYAEYFALHFSMCIVLPENVDLEHGAMTVVNPLTALAMMDRAKELGATAVIINAAGSQLGKIAIRLALKDNITPICTVRQTKNVQPLKDEFEGLHYVFSTEDPENFDMLMKEACTAKKPLVCLDAVAGETTGKMVSYLADKGTCIIYGNLSGQPMSGIAVGDILSRYVKIEGFWLTNWLPEKIQKDPVAYFTFIEAEFKPLLSTTFACNVASRFGVHQIKDGYESYMANQSAGKVLFQPGLSAEASEGQTHHITGGL